MCQWRGENYFLNVRWEKFLKPFVSACVLFESRSVCVGLQRKCLPVFVGSVYVSTVVLRLQPTYLLPKPSFANPTKIGCIAETNAKIVSDYFRIELDVFHRVSWFGFNKYSIVFGHSIHGKSLILKCHKIMRERNTRALVFGLFGLFK
jgi:hypothetical protein